MVTDLIFEKAVDLLGAEVSKVPRIKESGERFRRIFEDRDFKRSTIEALDEFKLRVEGKLPHFFNEDFIKKDTTQLYLAAYIIHADSEAITELAKTHAAENSLRAETVENILRDYLDQLCETLSSHPTFGALWVNRDLKTIIDILEKLVEQIADDNSEIKIMLREILVLLKQEILSKQAISGGLSATLYTDVDHLPRFEEGFYGREDEIKQLDTWLQDKQTALVWGFGGEGKTELAMRLVEKWLEDERGNVLMVNAGTSDVDTLFTALARESNNKFNATKDMALATSLQNKQATLRSVMKGSEIKLVVLDNVWDDNALYAVLKGLPRGTACLVTARSKWGQITKDIKLSPMPQNAALEILREHVSDHIDDEKEALELCELVYYNAFAVRVAAFRLKNDTKTVSELRQELQQRIARLFEMDYAGIEEERGNIAALIETTLAALPENARKVFEAWGAFWAPNMTPLLMALYIDPPEKPSFDFGDLDTENLDIDNLLNAFKSVLGLSEAPMPDDSDAKDALQDLQRYGLAIREPAKTDAHGYPQAVAYFRLHDLAFAYASNQILEGGLRQRALAACLTYTGQHDEPSRENFATLDPLIETFMGAAEYAYTSERWADAECFAWDLNGAADGFLSLSGYYIQALKLLEQAADAAQRAGNKQNQGVHLGNLGLAYQNLGQYEQAIQYHQQALAISQEIGNKSAVGSILGNLGNTYFSLGQYDKQIEYMEQVLEIARELGARDMEGSALGNLGNTYFSLGQYDKQIEYMEQVLEIARELGASHMEGNALGNLGSAYQNLGQYDKAIQYHQQALAISQEIGDKRAEGSDLGNLGIAYKNLGQYEQAIRYYEEAKVIFKALGVPYLIEQTERNIALLREAMADAGDESEA